MCLFINIDLLIFDDIPVLVLLGQLEVHVQLPCVVVVEGDH